MTKKGISYGRILGAVISISICAQLTINVGDIPITGQTLAILFWAFFLSTKESFFAIAIYLLLGFFGLPVFADGNYGFEKMLGGSGGYFIGFLIAAPSIAYLKSQYPLEFFFPILSLTTVGTIIILFFGVTRLMTLYGFEKGIEYGFIPFWQGALIKILIGSVLVWVINRLLKHRRNNKT